MGFRPGARLKSAGGVEVIVIRAAEDNVVIECGGQPMMPVDGAGTSGDTAPQGETMIGKRYVDEERGIELLCTKGGPGELACGGRTMQRKDAKHLPASD